MNLANKLTMLRVILVPIFLIFLIGKGIPYGSIIATLIFIIASLTDQLDGYIARSRNQITNFGKFMDPLADKLLVLSTLIALLEMGKFSVFGVSLGFVITIILARELAITSLRTIAADNGVVIAASKLGKYKTVSQMVMIIFLIIDCYPFTFLGGVARDVTALVLISIATILTIVSGIDYFIKNGSVLKQSK